MYERSAVQASVLAVERPEFELLYLSGTKLDGKGEMSTQQGGDA